MESRDPATREAARAAGFRLFGGEGAELVQHADGTLLDAAGARAGRSVALRDARDLAAAVALAGSEAAVLVDAAAGVWTIIPAENLVAAFAATRTRLLFKARSADDARVLFGALELGVDGVVLASDNAAEVAQLQKALRQPRRVPELLPAVVTRVVNVGLGDRACVDTASVLSPGEGLLLSSFASGFFLVLSEANETDFIAARPFRVNAGAVSNYALLGERTAYLSELAAGATVLLTDAAGKTHEEVVARIKLERRPLLLVEAQRDGQLYSVLLQNAETVRLATPSGSTSVSQLQAGEQVLVAKCSTVARHGGVAVEEQCVER